MSIRLVAAVSVLFVASTTVLMPRWSGSDIASAAATAAAILETHSLYENGAAPGYSAMPWSLKSEERMGGPDGNTRYLWLNGDWKAQPWGGVHFRLQQGQPWRVTPEWLANGFIRFYINGGVDRYGSPNGEIALQIRPITDGAKYQRLRPGFIDWGRGIDEDEASWQEVLVPLSYWTEVKAGAVISGFTIQCVNQPTRSFGVTNVAFVRFDRSPTWTAEARNTNVSQPWVTWPGYEELPELLKADLHPPEVQNGRFVLPGGERTFILNPYAREDSRIDVWGNSSGPARPSLGLYDAKQHGWIYDELLNAKSLSRLGFNSLSVTMPGQPFWEAVGHIRDVQEDPNLLPATAQRVGLPFYIDTVCWPWTIGSPASNPKNSNLPAEAFTTGRHHWTPYRIIGAGRDTWLQMWRIYAQRYKDIQARPLIFELFNEPGYADLAPEHLREFAEWLRRHHGSLAALNSAWGTNYTSWEQAATIRSDAELKANAGRFLDYDHYLADRFTALVADGVVAVTEILPNTLVGVQPMGGYALQPRDAVWKHRLVEHETVVLTPTGGGRWSPGASATRPAASLIDTPMAGSPLENDLLLSLAGGKMIYDNETYLRGQTARDTRNRLWEHVVSGLDGLTIFAWEKRGWSWHNLETLVTEADKYPYASLIPLARRTDALRGILDFASEVQPLADTILAKPWGPSPRIGLLYSWPQARRWAVEPTLRDKTGHYHAALRYGHWNADVLPSDDALAPGGMAGYDVIIAAGVRNIEAEMPAALEAFVRAGGVLLVAEEALTHDLYGRPLDTPERLGVRFGEWQGPQETTLAIPESAITAAITGSVRTLPDLRPVYSDDAATVVATADGRPVVTRRNLGRGLVYALAADLSGYPLAKVLAATLADAAQAKGHQAVPTDWRAVEVRTSDGQLAPNVLVSRRSYSQHHAVLMLNRDEYRKTVRVQIPGLTGAWQAREGVSGTQLTATDGWYELTLEPGDTRVLILER